jgi:hypothetical protein
MYHGRVGYRFDIIKGEGVRFAFSMKKLTRPVLEEGVFSHIETNTGRVLTIWQTFPHRFDTWVQELTSP